MTLRSRLAAGLLAIAVVLVVPLVSVVHSLQRLQADARSLRDREFAASLLLGRARDGVAELRRLETSLVLFPESATRDQINARLDSLRAIADTMARYDLQEEAVTIHAAVTDISGWLPTEFAAARAGRRNLADSVSHAHVVPAIGRAETAIASAEIELRERTGDRVAAAASRISNARRATLVGMVVAVMLAGIIAAWLTASITRPVRALERGMAAVAEGDFEHRLPISPDRSDEFGRLSASFGTMTRQLAELDKLKAEFVSVASHELKTPINVVIGYLQLLEDGLYGPMTEEQKQVLATLSAQSQSLSRLVRRLLDVSRFEAGGGRLEPRPVDLDGVLEELERTFQVLAMQRDIRFTVERGDDLPVQVFWDPDRMDEVLGNLLSNAFKFTPRGGSIQLVAEAHNGSVQLSVRDSGPGIPPDQVGQVFDKFFRASNQASAAHGNGTGLGLAISKQIVEAHGGTITCESVLDRGSTFTVKVPARVAGRSSTRLAKVAG